MANVDIELGYKDAAWFTANATRVLKQGQPVFLQQTGQFKIGDGTTQLQNLSFLGGATGATNGLQPITGNIGLGGNLTQNTTIDGNYALALGTSLSQLSDLSASSSGNVIFNGGDLNSDYVSLQMSGGGVSAALYGSVLNNSVFYTDPYVNIVSNATLNQYVSPTNEFIGGVRLSSLTANTVPYLNGTKDFTSSAVTPAQLNVLTAFNANVIGSTLTGYASSTGTISPTDTVLSAIEKLNGNIGALVTGVSSVNGLTGAVPLTGSSAINISGTNVFSINNSSITNAMLAGSIDLTSKVTGILPSANGGTGVNNGIATISIAGNVTHAGAFTQTFTATGNTSVTLPTSGTLANTAYVDAKYFSTIRCSHLAHTPAASTTYYFGNMDQIGPGVAGAARYVPVPSLATKLIGARIKWYAINSFGSGSGTNATVYFRLNNTTDTQLDNAVNTTGQYSNTISGLSTTVTNTDKFEIKITYPAYSGGSAPVNAVLVVELEWAT